MLTKKDLFLIGELIDTKIDTKLDLKFDEKFEEFAILMQNKFRAIHEEFRSVHEEFTTVHEEFTTVHEILETKADKTDITRLENKFEGRIERVEDNMRIVKTTLKLA